VLQVLVEAGFERLPTPLVVAGSKFEFEGAVRGTEQSHDLVVVAGPSTPPNRLVRLLSSLGRTLDQAESRRPVSLVLVGATPERSTMVELERQARVLIVDGDPMDLDGVRRSVAVLMPLVLPSEAVTGREPLEEVSHVLGRRLTPEHRMLIDAARFGSDAVRTALVSFVDGAIDEEGGSEP
jgi:hypothetical protein